MSRYDPAKAPKPDEWLALDEQERIALVQAYHRRERVDLPNATLHATIHTIVETQAAMKLPAVTDALARLRAEGLSRHDAVHAIGSVLAEHMMNLLGAEPSAGEAPVAYEDALRQLTAERWRDG